MRIKDAIRVIKKAVVISTLTLTAMGSFTACSFHFNHGDLYKSSRYDNTSTELFVESMNELVENTDFTNDEDLSSMTEILTELANGYGEEENLEFQKARLVRVVDGDTIVVEIENEEYKVRLIGVNTPESVASSEYLDRTGKENTEEGVEASVYTKDLLSEVEYVYLQKDTSETDKYGRLLRYAWIEMPNNQFNLEEISTKMINGILVSEKVAEPAKYEPDTMYADIFEELYDR